MPSKPKFSLLTAILYTFFIGALLISLWPTQQTHGFSNNHTALDNNEPRKSDETILQIRDEPTYTPSIPPTDTPDVTSTPTPTPSITPTIPPTATVSEYLRPIIVVQEYALAENQIKPGERGSLTLKIKNSGQTTARNIIIIFEAGELVPLETGGIRALSQLAPGEVATTSQPLMASSSLSGMDNAAMTIHVTYVDDRAINFTESFSLNFSVHRPVYDYQAPSPTPTLERETHPQLMIAAYRFNKSPLEAGMIFDLELDVINMGHKPAKDITLILGGGGADYSEAGISPSGITGAEADFSGFSPYNTANLRHVGDILPKDTLTLICPMIVNTDTKPGVHIFKISLAYFGEDGTSKYLDNQVITILIHRIPRIEISFYRDTGLLQVGNPGLLPVQVLNIDNQNLLVSSLEVSASESIITPISVQVGVIETGGYFTQDFNILPGQPGPVEIMLKVNYIDEFNQDQFIEKVMALNIEEISMPVFEEPSSENHEVNQPNPQNQGNPNFLVVLWRLLLGFLGLNSGA